MAAIHYHIGDATAPPGAGNRVIIHICNDIGRWGKGFVIALSRRWPEPERGFKDWYAKREQNDFALGAVQFVQVSTDLWIANMIAQHFIWNTPDGPPIRYAAVEQCLQKVAAKAKELNASIHMPRIGCGLAGGTWDRIEPLIQRTLVDAGLDAHVYDLPA
jgi:O-acetyl-ADP-ribose deacetylase (regulator of RNase III)